MTVRDIFTWLGDLRARGDGTPVSFPVDPNVLTDALGPLAQGEFLARRASDGKLVRFVRDGMAGRYVGISAQSLIEVRLYGNQPGLLAPFLEAFEVWTTGLHLIAGSIGETYEHGDPVYMAGTNTQAVTKLAAGGVVVGTVYLPDGSTQIGTARIPVLIDEATRTGGVAS